MMKNSPWSDYLLPAAKTQKELVELVDHFWRVIRASF